MTIEPDDPKMRISKFSTMDIEELKVNIDHLEKDIDNSNQLQILDFAKNVLDRKYKERQEQIDLLTKSLTSSSRIGRWISSGKAVLKQFVDFKK